MIAQAESFEEQIKTSTAAADGLKTEKIELSSRLGDTELALETTRTQLAALKVDSERLAAEVVTLRAENEGLQSQLTDLQTSLSDVLSEVSNSRQKNDLDRKENYGLSETCPWPGWPTWSRQIETTASSLRRWLMNVMILLLPATT